MHVRSGVCPQRVSLRCARACAPLPRRRGGPPLLRASRRVAAAAELDAGQAAAEPDAREIDTVPLQVSDFTRRQQLTNGRRLVVTFFDRTLAAEKDAARAGVAPPVVGTTRSAVEFEAEHSMRDCLPVDAFYAANNTQLFSAADTLFDFTLLLPRPDARNNVGGGDGLVLGGVLSLIALPQPALPFRWLQMATLATFEGSAEDETPIARYILGAIKLIQLPLLAAVASTCGLALPADAARYVEKTSPPASKRRKAAPQKKAGSTKGAAVAVVAPTPEPAQADEWGGDAAASQHWIEVCFSVFEALSTWATHLRYRQTIGLPPHKLHFVLPAAVARDADVFEARLRSLLYPLLSTPATSVVLKSVASILAKRGDALQLSEVHAHFRVTNILRRTLQRLVRSGCREAAGCLARAELEPRKAMKDTWLFRPISAAARWSTLDAMQPVAPGEVVVLFLPLDEPDLAWDVALFKAISTAEQGGALGVFAHVIGVGAGTPAAAAAEQRLEDALARSADRAAAVAAMAAAAAAAAAAEALASAVAAAIDAHASKLPAALAQLAAVPEPTPEAEAVLRLLSAVAALDAGGSDMAAADAARAAALAALPPRDYGSAAVAAALQRLDAARTRAAAVEVLHCAAEEAAAAEAGGASLDALLAAAPRWEAALAGAGGIACAESDALARSLGTVRQAAALAGRFTDAAAAANAGLAFEDELAMLRAALHDADAAPPAVAVALAPARAAAEKRCARLDALVALIAVDDANIAACVTAVIAAGATGTEIGVAIAARSSPQQAEEAAAAPEGWESAGSRIRFRSDDAAVLGTGSRGAVVFSGEYLSERADKAAAPAAVKRLLRPRGSSGAELLKLVQREVDVLRVLNARSTRIAYLFDYYADSDWVYIAYERCERSLAQALDAALPPPAQRVVWLQGVAAALAELHGLGYAHNDVHAGNVLLKDRGRTVKLTDVQFAVRTRGDAQRFSQSSVAALDVRLNMARRAPEVLNAGKLTTKVDVWALGVLAFQLLTGQASPFAPQRAKQGAGGKGGGGIGGGGGGGGGGLQAETEENRRIRCGECDLSLLDARELRLPRRTAAEARHLLAACLAVRPDARPCAADVAAHPLFWADAHALGEPLRQLRALDADEAALKAALEAAKLQDAYARLAGWKATAHAALLEAHGRAKPPARYGDGLAQLLRFARNCVEHSPSLGELPLSAANKAAASASAATEARRREAVVAHLLERYPELPLAMHVCLAAAAPSGAAAQQ